MFTFWLCPLLSAAGRRILKFWVGGSGMSVAVISIVEHMWWPSLWPSVLITCPKFYSLLPELELSLRVPFVLMLQELVGSLASDELALRIWFMTLSFLLGASLEFRLLMFRFSDQILTLSDSFWSYNIMIWETWRGRIDPSHELKFS